MEGRKPNGAPRTPCAELRYHQTVIIECIYFRVISFVLESFSLAVYGRITLGCRDGAVVRALVSHQCGPDSIGHFTVVCSATKPMNGCEAAGDLALIQTSLLLSCKLCCCNAN